MTGVLGALFVLLAQSAEQITDLAIQGRAREVVAAYERAPQAVEQDEDVRYDVAAAAVLAGKPDLARKLAASARKDEFPPQPWSVIEHALANDNRDPFDAAIDAFRGFGAQYGVRGQLLAKVLERSGYRDLAAEILERPAAAPTNTAFQRLIARPRIVPFAQRKLPKTIRRSNRTVIDCTDPARVAAAYGLPSHVHPIRMERDGHHVVAISISSAVDPLGELALGAYWILRSTDGGKTWRELYTGLREHMPYVVQQSSRLPLLAGDRLQIEVEVAELDPDSITFPPVALETKRVEKGLYLDFTWADLERDSDDDGLTDLLEERLVMDPFDADTDGDAIADGEDSLPQVAWSNEVTLRTEFLAEGLRGFELGGGRAVVGLAAAAPPANACEVLTSRTGERVMFLIADRAMFRPLRLDARVIVLTESEADAYADKFGPTFPARLRRFVIDRTGTRALINLDESWSGRTLLLKRTETGWQRETIAFWFS
jgi:hypothetical protein